MQDGDVAGAKVGVNGGLVCEDAFAAFAVDDSHDLSVTELLSSAAPVAMGHADVATALAPSLLLVACWDCPVKETARACACLVTASAVVVEKGSKATNDFFAVELLGELAVFLVAHAEGMGAGLPWVGADFIELEALLDAKQQLPLSLTELGAAGALHGGGLWELVSGLESCTLDVTDGEGEHAHHGQGDEVACSDVLCNEIAVGLDAAAACGYLEGGPEAVAGARGLGVVAAAQHDVTCEGVVLLEPRVGALQSVLGDLPCEQSSIGKAGGE